MNLTEREKWLMEQAWDSSRGNDSEEFDFWLSCGKSECGTTYTEKYLAKHAPKPESIVKTVDPDNLPDEKEWVLLFSYGRSFIGRLKKDDTGGIYKCTKAGTKLDLMGPKEKYIEQESLIKFIGES